MPKKNDKKTTKNMITLFLTIFSFFNTISVADFDGDCKSDVFILQEDKVYRYEGTAATGLLNFIPETFSPGQTSVALGNIDYDINKQDLITAGANGCYWWEPLENNSMYNLNNGFGAGVQSQGIAIVKNDDHTSYIYLRRFDNLTRYYCNSDNKVSWQTSTMTAAVQCIAAGDLNNTNSDDLLVGKSSGLHWYESLGSNSPAYKGRLASGDFKAITIGNLDGDSFPDIIAVVTTDLGDKLKWFESTRTDMVILTERVFSITDNSNFTCVGIGDIDGDGIGELLAGRSNGPVRWFIADQDNSLSELNVAPINIGAEGIAISSACAYDLWPLEKLNGDLNNDDLIDLKDFGTMLQNWGKTTDTSDSDFVQGQDPQRVKVLDRWTILTHSEDLNFPQFRISQNNKYAIGFGTGYHGATGWFKYLSVDEGKTWNSYSNTPGLLATVELPNNETVSMSYNTSATANPNVRTATVAHSQLNWKFNTSYSSTLTFPFAIDSFAFVRSMLIAANGTTIYAVGHCGSEDETNQGAMLLESDDKGINWNFKSKIAIRNHDWMGISGPSETAMVRLQNNNLLAVMRTGDMFRPITEAPADCPMAYTISDDDGATWATPQNMNHTGVFPDMVVLDNGTVVMLSGRPGVYIRLASPDGLTWSEPHYIFQGTGCANSSMQINARGNPVIIYTETDFCGHQYPGYTNYLKMLELAIDSPCGINGYLKGDLNQDCIVNIEDFSIFFLRWLDNAEKL